MLRERSRAIDRVPTVTVCVRLFTKTRRKSTLTSKKLARSKLRCNGNSVVLLRSRLELTSMYFPILDRSLEIPDDIGQVSQQRELSSLLSKQSSSRNFDSSSGGGSNNNKGNIGSSSISSSQQRRSLNSSARPLKTLREAKNGVVPTTACRVTLTELNSDILYKACLRPTCNKKVEDVGGGTYRCNKCKTVTEGFNWRLRLVFHLLDFTDHQWIIAFGDQAEALLGASVEDLAHAKEQDVLRYLDLATRPLYKDFVVTLRINRTPSKISLEAISELDLVDHNWRLIEEIKALSA
ncbi:Replication factor A C-terminal [Trinorchestia longiramus]|nr:Replication factor A C-terminal [Trinorchestia longiramus]